MKYYKIVKNNNIVGVATSNDLRFLQISHNFLLPTNEDRCEYIECNTILYHDRWMRPLRNTNWSYTIADVIEIEETDYNSMIELFETNEELEIPVSLEPEMETEPVIEESDITLEFAREFKIKQLSSICNSMIEQGIDVTLSDGLRHHFSLTAYDQINLLNASIMIKDGATQIPYHADNESYKMYSASDINLIISAANQHKMYHTMYFNNLKTYINNQTDINAIINLKYNDII